MNASRRVSRYSGNYRIFRQPRFLDTAIWRKSVLPSGSDSVLRCPGKQAVLVMDKPYQVFDDLSDAATVSPRLAALRAELARRGLDGFVVPHSDEYQSEYLPACNERLAWLTSFTGSAGAAVVLKDKAAGFGDGRYTLQVRQQTDTKLFEPRDLTAEGPNGWLEVNAPKGARIGYDPWVFSAASAEALRQSVEKAGATLVPADGNPIDAVWHDRPASHSDKARPHRAEVG